MNTDIVEAATDSIERCYIHTYQEYLKFYLNSDGYKIKRTIWLHSSYCSGSW